MELIAKYQLPHQRVILMPEGTSEASLQEKSAWLVETCERDGFRFSTRLHIILYGNKRAI